ISACSRREHPANSAETASPIAIEQVSVPGATATPPAPAASAAVGAAASASVPTQAAVVPLKVPVEDTQEPISVDGAAVPSAKAAKK
ncbi:MAG: hypothetical protein M3N23_09235, partial [Pseudomonadota bacterium]|nr:hypothetical protein [Pseudomonadota bacterium]